MSIQPNSAPADVLVNGLTRERIVESLREFISVPCPMKKNIPESIIVAGHPDYAGLHSIALELIANAGGVGALKEEFPMRLRECIDNLIRTPETGRMSLDELDKTEKTYLGTSVEIMLRALFNLPRGRLDTYIQGQDADIKFTTGSNWMIPTEAFGQICLLAAADESRAVSYLGLAFAKIDYLNPGENKDKKKSFSAQGFKSIYWILKDFPYPKNFWQTLPASTVLKIVSGRSGNERVAMLFREVMKRPINRETINATARQIDFTRRIRADKGRGVRNKLASEGVTILNGAYGKEALKFFGLPQIGKSEWLSYKPEGPEELNYAIEKKLINPSSEDV